MNGNTALLRRSSLQSAGVSRSNGRWFRRGRNIVLHLEGTPAFNNELANGWAGEIVRSSREYIRWIQNALNKILNLGLLVDGIIGPKTRSAIRAFQQRFGLTVDGIVGPQTEGALKAAGAGSSPGSGSIATSKLPAGAVSPILSGQAVSPTPQSAAALRANIVRIALGERQRWGNGSIKEGNSQIHPILRDYWSTGTGTNLTEPNWWSKYPWSAAFISWVMRKAGAGSAFRYSGGHSYYIHAAKQNRVANNTNPFKAYRTSETAPRVGDLVCKSRAGSGATYDNIQPGMSTHCDIVADVRQGQLTTVGGNVSDTVGSTSVQTDANGMVVTPGYFAVIRTGA